MTREDIIRMAREAELERNGYWEFDMNRLARFAALAAEQPKHPGYIIGSHWLETAYSRICAGEAEADVLRDCGWERVDDIKALRRDAERYRWLREKDGITVDVTVFGSMEANLDAAIDAAMEASTAPASAAADSSTAPKVKP